MKLTVKQERFIEEVLKGSNLSASYRAVYACAGMQPQTINKKASELRLSGPVAARLAQVRERAAATSAYTLSKAMDEAENARRLAHDASQAGAAVAAVTLKAKLSGHLIEKREVRVGALEDSDLDELLAMRDELRARAVWTEEDGSGSVDRGNRPVGRAGNEGESARTLHLHRPRH